MDETLIAACQMFLVPATILFAAIAIANTEPLKFLISAIGTVLAGVWYGRLTVWDLSHADKITAKWLAGTFFVAALVSTVVHGVVVGRNWYNQLGNWYNQLFH